MAQFHIDKNIFIVEGKKTFQKLMKSNLEIISIFALSNYYEDFSNLIKSKSIDENVLFSAEKKLMNEIIGFKLHQGIMAIAKQPLASLLYELSSPIIVMNGIVNSENVGSIIRNAVAFGINSLIFDNETSNPYLRRSVRVSMGTVMDMKYHQTKNLIATLDNLKKQQDYSLIAVEICDIAIPIQSFNLPLKTAVIFGSEGNGIDNNILGICDEIIYIPINSSVPSINVAATSAIVFNTISNQRKK